MEESTPIKVILIDDNQRIRSLVREVLQSEEDIKVCDEAASLKVVGPLISQWQPDILVVDIMHQEYGGEEIFLKEISRLSAADMKIIILSAHSESYYSNKCLKAGACGYVSKDKIISSLASAIRTVHDGQTFVSSSS